MQSASSILSYPWVSRSNSAHVARSFMNSGTGVTVDHSAGQEQDEWMSAVLVNVGPSVSHH